MYLIYPLCDSCQIWRCYISVNSRYELAIFLLLIVHYAHNDVLSLTSVLLSLLLSLHIVVLSPIPRFPFVVLPKGVVLSTNFPLPSVALSPIPPFLVLFSLLAIYIWVKILLHSIFSLLNVPKSPKLPAYCIIFQKQINF